MPQAATGRAAGRYDASRIHEDSASMTPFRPNETAAIPVAGQ